MRNSVTRRYLLALTLCVASLAALPTGASAQSVDPAANELIISEFRTRGGPGNNILNEFIELYNNSNNALNIGGNAGNAVWILLDGNGDGPPQGDFQFRIPPGTPPLPPRRHFLIARNDANYTLAGYATPDMALPIFEYQLSGGGTSTQSLRDGVGIQVKWGATGTTTFMTHLDSVASWSADSSQAPAGCAGVTCGRYHWWAEPYTDPPDLAVPPMNNGDGTETSYTRIWKSGQPQDTNITANDWQRVNTTNRLHTESAPAPGVLGAPSPQSSASPRQRNSQTPVTLLDPSKPANASPNIGWNPGEDPDNDISGKNGPGVATLRIRRTITNNTGAQLTALRLRVVDLLTLRDPLDDAGAMVRMRLLPTRHNDGILAQDVTPTCVTATVLTGGCVGADLDGVAPANYFNKDPLSAIEPDLNPLETGARPGDEEVAGTGLYSSAKILLPAGGVAPGGTVNVEVRFGVEKTTGTYRFLFNNEAQ
jgi:hypothetical protein